MKLSRRMTIAACNLPSYPSFLPHHQVNFTNIELSLLSRVSNTLRGCGSKCDSAVETKEIAEPQRLYHGFGFNRTFSPAPGSCNTSCITSVSENRHIQSEYHSESTRSSYRHDFTPPPCSAIQSLSSCLTSNWRNPAKAVSVQQQVAAKEQPWRASSNAKCPTRLQDRPTANDEKRPEVEAAPESGPRRRGAG